MTTNNEEYLQPSELCDFDRCPEIRTRALELTSGCQSSGEMFQRVFAFVKELPYGLEDWDVSASDVLWQDQPSGGPAQVPGYPGEVPHFPHQG